MGNCYEAAIEYATKYKWAVFPVSEKTKKPLTPHGCKDAKKAVGPIKAWWRKWPNASVGIATGSISGLIVIDLDIDEDKGIDGYQSLKAWERVHGELPETVQAITGRGGSHLYYAYSGTDIKNRAGILEGVDVRGEGGYIIAPPSVHPNGTEYQWEYPPEEYDVAPLDGIVKEFLVIGKESTAKKQLELPDVIQPGQRNETLFQLACSLQAQGVPDDAILATVSATNQQKCYEPLDDDEIQKIVESALSYKKGELKKFNANGLPEKRDPKLTYKVTKEGEVTDQPAQTIKNAEEAITFDDELYGRIRWNEMAHAPYVYGNVPWKMWSGWREWNNFDDSNLKSYIEANYGIKAPEKIMDALTNVSGRYPVNPVIDALETCRHLWDGQPHICNLLPDMLGAEKTEYTTAVMEVFMFGAIMRVLSPGCQFDYMMVLVGEQGCGKSSFLRYLAIRPEWFNDNFSTFDTAKAIENMRGMWIVEVGELQAMRRAKDVEGIKAFITSRVDTYRPPYGRRTEQRPRMCVLAGTTNSQNFLTDTTGNRRFLPVTCHADQRKFLIHDDEERTKSEIIQAWGEAYDAVKRGEYRLALPSRLEAQAIMAQEEYMEDDVRVGAIQAWLDAYQGDRVCIPQIWKEALKNEYIPITRKETNELHTIMQQSITGWQRIGKQRCQEYGTQRAYGRIEGFENVPETAKLPFEP